MKIGIIYHGKDWDGMASCALIQNFWLDHMEDGDEFVLMPIDYGENIKEAVKEQFYDRLYITDFTPESRHDCDYLLTLCPPGKLYWFDHHKRAVERTYEEMPLFANLPGVRSQAEAATGLVWDFFHPHEPMPPLIQAINDFDIWRKDGRFKWDDVLAIQEWMWINKEILDPKSFSATMWSEGNNLCEYDPLWRHALNQGKILLEKQRQIYKKEMEHAFPIRIGDLTGVAVNSHNKTSEIFGDMLQNVNFGLIFTVEKNMVKCSLRSEHVDCAEIAEWYGGGGHKAAAGFRIPLSQLEKVFAGEIWSIK